MGTTMARTYVRTEGAALASAVEVLREHGYEVWAADDDSLVVRTIRVWRDRDWLVLEDEDMHAPGDLGEVASRRGDTLTIDCFTSDVAIVGRYQSGMQSGMLLVGPMRPPGAGHINGLGVGAFADLLRPGVEVGELRSLTKRTRRDADRVCDALLGLFDLSFTEMPDAVETIRVTNGERISEAVAPRLRASGASFADALHGVAGDRAGTVVGVAGFECEGERLDRVVLDLSGSAIEHGLIDVDSVMYVVRGRTDVAPAFIDRRGTSFVLDLGQFERAGQAEDVRTNGPQAINIGLEGRFGTVGRGDLVLTLTDVPATTSATLSLTVSALDPEFAPARRPRFPSRSGGRPAAMNVLAGTEVVIATLHLEPGHDTDGVIEMFDAWLERLRSTTSYRVEFSYVDGVRSLPLAQLGGGGQRWARVRDRLARGGDFEAVISIDGKVHQFAIHMHSEQTTRDVDRLQFSIPNHHVAFEWTRDVVDTAAARGLAWQASVGRYAQPGEHPRPQRFYEAAVGHNRLIQLQSRRYLAEPSRMVIISENLASQLDRTKLDPVYESTHIGELVRLVAAHWPALHTMEDIFEPILRPIPTDAEELPGLSRAFHWGRPSPS